MNSDEGNNSQQMHIDIPADVAQGVYSNLAVVSHSTADFVVDFIRMLPGMPKPQLKSRIILAPEHAKRLMLALADNVRKYESTFGEIALHDAPAQQGVAPFPLPKGKA